MPFRILIASPRDKASTPVVKYSSGFRLFASSFLRFGIEEAY